MLKTAADLIKAAQKNINCLSAEEAKVLFDQHANSAVIIDVRDTQSAEESKLTDSINISRGLLEMKIGRTCPEADTLIFTHCAGGGRASLSALTLQSMGYSNVYAITAKFQDIKNLFG